MRTSKYIADLLRKHDCVILPGFGGFVANYQPARLHPTRHTVTPPDKFVAFNKSLVNNDGLLIDHVAQAEGISFADAEKKVKLFIQDCERALTKDEVIILPEVGKLYKDTEKQVRFVRDIKTNHYLGSYGLEPVQFPPIDRSSTDVQPVSKKEKTQRKKERRKSGLKVNYYMVVILLLSSALVFQWHMYDMNFAKIQGIQLSDTSIAGYFSNIFGTTPDRDKIVVEQAKPELTPEGTEKITNEEDLMGLEPPNYEQPAQEELNVITEEGDALAEPANDAEEPVAEPIELAQPVGESGIYIVIGSFNRMHNATILRDQMISKGLDAIVIPSQSGNKRVGVGSYATRNAAKQAMPAVKEVVPSAWILVK
jgi:nucleoid DNA-binding protein